MEGLILAQKMIRNQPRDSEAGCAKQKVRGRLGGHHEPKCVLPCPESRSLPK